MPNKRVLLYRTDKGEIAALSDVCPHRAVALHRGETVGDRIRCPYHALEFDPLGICRLNPHLKGPTDRIRARAYPGVERYRASANERALWYA
jgi:phenylpropionate dioxygenase-like ring-hydroxylating dioxygenase large terminal subunit